MECSFSRLSSRPFHHPTSLGWSGSGRGCRQTCRTNPLNSQHPKETRDKRTLAKQHFPISVSTFGTRGYLELQICMRSRYGKWCDSKKFQRVLLLHWDHLWPDVATLDGWVDLRDVLWFTPRIILQYRQRMETRKKKSLAMQIAKTMQTVSCDTATFCLAVPWFKGLNQE